MNSGLFLKLAKTNIFKNKNTYVPFFISSTTMIALFYIIYSVTLQSDVSSYYGSKHMNLLLGFGTIICGMFSVCIIFYTNSFLMRKRTKELGLYSILGMEKKHIGKVLFLEILTVGIVSIAAGLISGVIFSKLMFFVLLKLLKMETTIAFGIPMKAVATTAILYIGAFIVLIIYNRIKIAILKPIDMLTNSKAGEREPKAKWFMAIVGIISLSIGCIIAIKTENPISALFNFFIAVLCVIVGTYMLFVAGSIAFLKILKKNKKYYYHKTHFITVSGMMYRMKQNAVGLASICILSTAVLVTLSSTVSLYVGIEDVMRTRYASDVITDYIIGEDVTDLAAERDKIKGVASELEAKYNIIPKNIKAYYDYSSAFTVDDNNKLCIDDGSMDNMVIIDMASLEDLENEDVDVESLKKQAGDDCLIYSTNKKLMNGTSIDINGEKVIYKTIDKETVDVKGTLRWSIDFDYAVMYIPTTDRLDEIVAEVDTLHGQEKRIESIEYNYSFDIDGEDKDKIDFCNNFRDALNDAGVMHVATVENIYTSREDIMALYASLLFIGIFIGAIFLLATVLIIYYKQISEGYDDKERFQIMQKVGMSEAETKKIIKSQIVTVFFMPIIVAIVHIAFAFQLIRKLLAMLNFGNTPLFVLFSGITIAIFCVIYLCVYRITAKAY